MDEQALLGLNPNADARYRQRVSRRLALHHRVSLCQSADLT